MTISSKLLIILSSSILLFSCGKQKNNPPVIELEGDREVEIELGEDYVEPGYTAKNYKGDDITSDVVVSGDIDKNKTGSYLVFYDVSDQNDNMASTVERVVEVKNGADFLDGFYSVTYEYVTATSTNVTGTTIDEVKTSNTINNRFYLANPAAFYAEIDGTTITVPTQGDLITGQWQGTGTVEANGDLNFDIQYTDQYGTYQLQMQYEMH